MTDNPYDIIVIAAGQAGLASTYYLPRAGSRLLVLDGAGQVGESGLQRWDSLRLFTPVRYNSLPGLPFPGEPYALPAKDDVATGASHRAYIPAFASAVSPSLVQRGHHNVCDSTCAISRSMPTETTPFRG